MKNKFILVIFIGSLMIGVGLLLRYTRSIKQTPYNPGDVVTNLIISLSDNTQMTITKGKWYLFLAASDWQDKFSFIKYVDYMIKNVFNSVDLEVILFGTQKNETLNKFKTSNDLSIKTASMEDNNEIPARFFNGYIDKQAACLINDKKAVAFLSLFVMENDLRQLLEKHIIGKIQYQDTQHEPLKIGDTFPGLKVVNIKTGDETFVGKDSKKMIWFIFTSNCVACALNSNLMTYSMIETSLLNKLSAEPVLIFSPFFILDDIDQKLKEFNVTTTAYRAEEEIKDIENCYFKSIDKEKNVIVFITGSTGKVIYTESLQTFLVQLKGDYFEKNKGMFQ